MLVTGEAGIDGADGVADDRAAIDIRSGRGGRCGEGDAERAAAFTGHVVHEEATPVRDQLGRPEVSLGPARLGGEDGAGGLPMNKILRTKEGELRRPLAGGRRGPELIPHADD